MASNQSATSGASPLEDPVPPETQDLQDFMTDNPNEAVHAQVTDEVARNTLKKAKYDAFGQGLRVVIEKRTRDFAAGFNVPGPRDMSHEGKKAKHHCTEQNCSATIAGASLFDISRHMQTHNRTPGLSVYCPECLKRICRADADTPAEHIINNHLEVIFGDNIPAYPIRDFDRVIQFNITFKANVMGRLNKPVIRQYVLRLDQPLLESRIQARGMSTLADLRDQLRLDVSEALQVIQAQGGAGAAVGGNGLLTEARIARSKKDVLIEYVIALRRAIDNIDEGVLIPDSDEEDASEGEDGSGDRDEDDSGDEDEDDPGDEDEDDSGEEDGSGDEDVLDAEELPDTEKLPNTEERPDAEELPNVEELPDTVVVSESMKDAGLDVSEE